MKLGYIICEDNKSAQQYWLEAFRLIFKAYNINPHVITKPEMAKEDYFYIWRPGNANFNGIYKNTKELSLKLAELGRSYENKGTHIFPNSQNLEFYENKLKIHETVVKHNIKAPKTYHFSNLNEAMDFKNEIKFPVLLKHAYSCNSHGLLKADNVEELEKNLKEIGSNISSYVIQQRLNIKRDIRINYVGTQTILAYSRVIASGAISSASRFKSKIDHFTIPYQSYNYAYRVGQLFNSPFGGIDFVWEDGMDTNDEPYLLEISPMFDLNPMPMKPVEDWSKFKNSWNWKKYYKQAILFAAQLEISYMIFKYNNHSVYDEFHV